jgi:PAS domain S-box-containing protein
MGLSTRLTVAMVSLVLLTAAAVGFLSYRNIEATILPVILGGGAAALVAAVFAAMLARSKTAALQREIEERRRAEALVRQLSARERLYAAAVESAHDAIITTDFDGIITAWNAGAERMLGFSPDEAIGQHISIMAGPERSEEQVEYLQRLRRGERIQDVETVRRAKDGTLREISLTLWPVMGPDGAPVGVSAIYRDIAPREQADERFRLAVEASPGAMIMADKDGRIQLVNAEAERMLGYERGELIGKPVELLIPNQLRAAHERDRSGFAANPARRAMGKGRDLFAVRKDGSEIAVEIGLNPIATQNRMMVMAAIVDITERKAAEKVLAERVIELQRSNAELEQFAYVASHDLQEPLRMVASYAELLAERYRGKLDDKADKYIGYAVDGAKRMQRLVNDLLAYSRVGRRDDPAKPTDMNRVVQDVLQGLRGVIGDTHAEVEIGTLPTVMADDGQIAQVLQNLIGNALKFRGKEQVRIRIDAKSAPQGWLFSVQDNGIGIEAQYSERVFQMFQRLHDRETYEGNGIGLTIAKKIIERHGGRIWFESEPGRGTTFFFTLPQIREKAA